MKKYINPELDVKVLSLDTGIMDASFTDTWGDETEDEGVEKNN